MRSTRAAMAQASTASSSGSRQTGIGSGGASNISVSRRTSSRERSREVRVRARMSSNLSRPMTSANSASKTGLPTSVRGRCARVRASGAALRAKATPQSGCWYQGLPARRLRSARAALTSALISSIDIGGMPAASTRAAIESNESAACWRLSASLSSRSSACGVSSPAARAA